MPTFRPFQDYDEHDVINGLFTLTGIPPISKGTFVKVQSGFLGDQGLKFGAPDGNSYNNTVSFRWNVPATIATCDASGDNAIGMTLYDYKEVDEHGNKLVFDPRKTIEVEAILSGQAMPIVTRGLFLYSGIEGSSPTAGAPAFLGVAGGVTASGGNSTTANYTAATRVGTWLGPKDGNGFALLALRL